MADDDVNSRLDNAATATSRNAETNTGYGAIFYCTIDRLEPTSHELLALLELPSGEVVPVPAALLPEGLEAGDVLAVQHTSQAVVIRQDTIEASKRHERLSKLRAQIAARSEDDGGDLEI
jgi:hypothetical protein